MQGWRFWFWQSSTLHILERCWRKSEKSCMEICWPLSFLYLRFWYSICRSCRKNSILRVHMDWLIHHDGITDSLDWLSGGENLPEILLGYHQYHDGDNEYSYCNLLRKMDKINHSDEPYSTVTSCARGLYRNPMLCERLAGGTRILLKQKENRKIL